METFQDVAMFDLALRRVQLGRPAFDSERLPFINEMWYTDVHGLSLATGTWCHIPFCGQTSARKHTCRSFGSCLRAE